jgi:hypothetical protein
MMLHGPGPDFILGRIYEFTQNQILKDVIFLEDGSLVDDGSSASEALEQQLATNKYYNNNCRLIGR